MCDTPFSNLHAISEDHAGRVSVAPYPMTGLAVRRAWHTAARVRRVSIGSGGRRFARQARAIWRPFVPLSLRFFRFINSLRSIRTVASSILHDANAPQRGVAGAASNYFVFCALAGFVYAIPNDIKAAPNALFDFVEHFMPPFRL
jgi:hypothetical protein